MTADLDQPEDETRQQRAIRWRADEARRRRVVAGASTWEEMAQRLHAAGEIERTVLDALGLAAIPADQHQRSSRYITTSSEL